MTDWNNYYIKIIYKFRMMYRLIMLKSFQVHILYIYNLWSLGDAFCGVKFYLIFGE